MNTEYRHQYRVGDAVLADLNGARVPGVVEDEQEGKLLIRLAEPWIDETDQKSDEVWLTPDKLAPSLEEETGGSGTLPR